jgi:hypothetical protein
MQPQTLAEDLYFVTVPIWASDDEDEWIGTGFLVAVPVSGGGEIAVLVTNKHVVSTPDRMNVGLHAADESGAWIPGLGFRVNLADHIDGSQVVGHPDDEIDVAVLPITPALGGIYDGRAVFYKSIPARTLWLEDRIETLDALSDVVFVGYPAGVYDDHNNTPIIRRGMAATPLNLDYEGKPTFLIDAAVHPGSSGSPVCLWNSGSHPMKGVSGFAIGSRFGVLGVLAAVHQAPILGELVSSPVDTRPLINYPVGLGIVYKSSTILETVDVLLKQLGIERHLGQAEGPPNEDQSNSVP